VWKESRLKNERDKKHGKEKYMWQMRGREREKLRFKCLNSDRDGIKKKAGIQTKTEKKDTDR